MKKALLLLGVGVVAFMALVAVLKPPKPPQSPETASFLSQERFRNDTERSETNMEIFQADDGRKIVAGVLPPELKDMNKRLVTYKDQIQAASPPAESIFDDPRDPEEVITKMDLLIEETSKKLGVDSVAMTALLEDGLPLNPEMKEVEEQRLKVESDVIALENRFQ
ncbi:hypothetical protein [Leucothrix pacifica]|uniref:Uncharacterized protein n=1 Tax=Leucothrix pacifica TaxID=1247513 RepID=A0A317C1P9_9GAMM|nr:hypothetical protein [Leucothrix pacifica]PWQ92289.1 hypothetical protein DKW60_21935 [Leucothrix pacifica]